MTTTPRKRGRPPGRQTQSAMQAAAPPPATSEETIADRLILALQNEGVHLGPAEAAVLRDAFSRAATAGPLSAPGRRGRERPPAPAGLDPLAALTRDLRTAALTLGDDEARFLVDAYYITQRDRIRGMHQMRSLSKGGEPHEVLAWFMSQSEAFENQVQKALDAYSGAKIEGKWARSLIGIGPVIAAGLLANIDINKSPTVGHIWRFAGLDPSSKWLPGTKRPWNGSLKRLCFLIGESFTKVAGHPNDVYGKLYRARRLREVRLNDEGRFVDQAIKSLEEKNYRKETDAFAWYAGCYPAGTCSIWNDLERKSREVWPDDSSSRAQWLNKERNAYLLHVRVDAGKGQQMLPPARILLRAQRYPTKMFLSHFHHVLHEVHLGAPPRMPYILSGQTYETFPELEEAFSQIGVHGSYFAPPNWPMEAA